MKVTIYDARSLEHAIEQALQRAESEIIAKAAPNDYRTTHVVSGVTFVSLRLSDSGRGKSFEYTFEATLEAV